MADSDIETSSNQNSNSNTSHSTTSTTSVHVTALDGIVSANSLFTVAVFVGISFDQPSDLTLTDRTECSAGRDVERDLVVFEVISFAFFLFSSLVAQGMKLAINLLNSKERTKCLKRISTEMCFVSVWLVQLVDLSWVVYFFCCQLLMLYNSVWGFSLAAMLWRFIPCWCLWYWSLLLSVFISSQCSTLSGND